MEYMTKHGVGYSAFVHGLVKSPHLLLQETNWFKSNLTHMIFGITGEAGELLEWANNNGPFFYNGEITDLPHLIEELGDYEFYFTELCQHIGITNFEPNRLEDDPLGNLVVCLAIQSTQMLDCAKKHTIYNKPLDLEIATFHCSNIRNLLDKLYMATNILRDQVLEANVEKLSKRYESLKYSDKAAHERKDKETPDPALT